MTVHWFYSHKKKYFFILTKENPNRDYHTIATAHNCTYSSTNKSILSPLFCLMRWPKRTSMNNINDQKMTSYLFPWELFWINLVLIYTQDVHSDRRKRRRIRPETTIKRLKSCRKRPPFPTVFHRFRAVIRHSRLRNGLNRTGKRRRFMPFPSNNG